MRLEPFFLPAQRLAVRARVLAFPALVISACHRGLTASRDNHLIDSTIKNVCISRLYGHV